MWCRRFKCSALVCSFGGDQHLGQPRLLSTAQLHEIYTEEYVQHTTLHVFINSFPGCSSAGRMALFFVMIVPHHHPLITCHPTGCLKCVASPRPTFLCCWSVANATLSSARSHLSRMTCVTWICRFHTFDPAFVFLCLQPIHHPRLLLQSLPWHWHKKLRAHIWNHQQRFCPLTQLISPFSPCYCTYLPNKPFTLSPFAHSWVSWCTDGKALA